MSLHHLDPRQAGTGAKPDLWVFFGNAHGLLAQAGWYSVRNESNGPFDGPHENEAAALAAARAAAGFGHVAERACDKPTCNVAEHELCPQCSTCYWDRDAHQEGSK